MTKKGELALVVLAVGVALILTGFGLLKVLFDIEIPSVEMAYLAIIGTFLAALGLTILVQSLALGRSIYLYRETEIVMDIAHKAAPL